MKTTAKYLAAGLMAGCVLAAPVAGEITCSDAQDALEIHFGNANAQNDRFSWHEFDALSENQKWFWTSGFLSAQIRRLDALLTPFADVCEDPLNRAVLLFETLDTAEACYEETAIFRTAFRNAPDSSDRVRLRSEIEPRRSEIEECP